MGTILVATPEGAAGVTVTPSAGYSAIAVVRCSVVTTARLNILWWKADGTASATPKSSPTLSNLSTPNTWSNLTNNNATSPSDAAFASLELEWNGNTGDVMNVDNVAFARATAAVWSPGGTANKMAYVVERSEDGGTTWEAVWGASRYNSIHALSAANSESRLVDRAAAFSRDDVKYQAYAVGYNAQGLPVYSTVTQATAPAIIGARNWLRSPYHPEWDIPIHIESMQHTFDVGGDLYTPASSDYSIVTYNAKSFGRTANLSVRTDNKAVFETLMTMLHSRETLYIQGHLPNQKWWGRVNGQPSYEQVRAQPLIAELSSVRHLFKVSFTLVEVAPEESPIAVIWDPVTNLLLNQSMQNYENTGYIPVITPPPTTSTTTPTPDPVVTTPDPVASAPVTRTVDVGSYNSPPTVKTTATSASTAAFTPEDGSLMVAFVGLGHPTSGTSIVSGTVTDSIGGNWVCLGRAQTGGYSTAEIWAADAGTGLGLRTVNLTTNNSPTGVFLKVLVVRGAAALAQQRSPVRMFNNSGLTNNVRTAAANSLEVAMTAASTVSATVYGAATGSTLIDHWEDSQANAYAATYLTEETKANGQYTMGAALTSGSSGGVRNQIVWEIIASGVTLPTALDLPSAGFEDGTLGTWGDLPAGNTMSVTTGQYHSGGRAMQFVSSGAAQKVYAPSPVASTGLPVEAGGLVQARASFATASTGGVNARILTEFRSSAHANVLTQNVTATLVASNGWTTTTGNTCWNVPVGAAYVNAGLQFDAAATYYVDDIILEYIPPTLFLTNDPADGAVTVGTETKKMASFTAPTGTSVLANINSVAGPTTGLQFTDSTVAGTDGNPLAWFSPPLQAAFLAALVNGGAIGFRYVARESNAAANMAIAFKIDLCSGDGTVVSNIVPVTPSQLQGELGTTAGGVAVASKVQNNVATTITAGQRLKITAWVDDAADQSGVGTMAAGYNAQLWFGGNDNLGVAFSFQNGLAAA